MKVKNNKKWLWEPRRKFLLGLMLALSIAAFASCANVKPYQKMYLNDEDMKLSPRPLEGYETSIESYREGSSGANGGKTGGGCGCN